MTTINSEDFSFGDASREKHDRYWIKMEKRADSPHWRRWWVFCDWLPKLRHPKRLVKRAYWRRKIWREHEIVWLPGTSYYVLHKKQ